MQTCTACQEAPQHVDLLPIQCALMHSTFMQLVGFTRYACVGHGRWGTFVLRCKTDQNCRVSGALALLVLQSG